MTRFRFEFEAVCPSDWDETKAREWIAKHLTGEEKQTLRVMQAAAADAIRHDLYAALEAMVIATGYREGDLTPNDPLRQARAALAKARGESPDAPK